MDWDQRGMVEGLREEEEGETVCHKEKYVHTYIHTCIKNILHNLLKTILAHPLILIHLSLSNFIF